MGETWVGRFNALYPTVSFAGGIAAGKTTLAKAMARSTGRKYHPEPDTVNGYLKLFYAALEKRGESEAAEAQAVQLATLTQMKFMGDRVRHIIELYEREGAQVRFVQDRSAWEDKVFAHSLEAQGLIDANGMELYNAFFDTFALKHGEKMPAAVVFLDVDPAVLFKRYQARATEGEKVTLEYLQSFVEHYNRFIEDMAKNTRVFVVNYNKARDVSNKTEVDDTVALLAQRMIEAVGDAKKGKFVVSLD